MVPSVNESIGGYHLGGLVTHTPSRDISPLVSERGVNHYPKAPRRDARRTAKKVDFLVEKQRKWEIYALFLTLLLIILPIFFIPQFLLFSLTSPSFSFPFELVLVVTA